MARPGITYHDVAQAAQQLQANYQGQQQQLEQKTNTIAKDKQIMELIQAQNKKLDEQNNLKITLQKDVALLNEKFNIANKTIENLTVENKNLTHEKWILGQEKSQLLGQLDIYK